MANVDKGYQDLLSEIYFKGYDYSDPNRSGVSRRELSHCTATFDLDYFPAITLKRLFWKGVVGELLWFLSGSDNIKELHKKNIHIWDKDAYNYYKNNQEGYSNYERWYGQVTESDEFNKDFGQPENLGALGRVYGPQWRGFTGLNTNSKDPAIGKYVDQISKLIDNLRKNPMRSDLIVTAWNPTEIDDQALPPCHFGFQCVARPLTYTERLEHGKIMKTTDVLDDLVLDRAGAPKYGLTLVWDQRSCDTFLGIPFNIASYALLTHILAKMANMVPLQVIGDLRKVHLYDNSFSDTLKVVGLDADKHPNVKLEMSDTLNFDGTIDEFLESAMVHDFVLQGYKSYPPIKVDMLSRDA